MKQGVMITVLVTGVIAAFVVLRVLADEPAQPDNQYVCKGIVQSIDLKARTITVEGPAVPLNFTVPTDAEIVVKDKPRGDLSDLRISDGVRVKYTDDGDVHVAHQISLLSLKAP